MSGEGIAPGWGGLEGRAPRSVEIGGVHVGRGSLVRLAPRSRGDAWDAALAGRSAVVELIQQGLEGGVQLAVVLEDDPGRDLGVRRQPGLRFFFAPEEVGPLGKAAFSPSGCSILVTASATCCSPTAASASGSRGCWASASCRPA